MADMTRSDRIIADLVSALDAIDQAAADGQPLAYIQGMARQAQDNANAYRTRNSDGYLVVRDTAPPSSVPEKRRMTDAATLVRRITAAKYPNGGRYLFEPYELQQFIEAVQRDARASAPTGDDDMATFLLRRIDDDLWQRFLALAAAERVTPKELLLRVITAYVNGAVRR